MKTPVRQHWIFLNDAVERRRAAIAGGMLLAAGATFVAGQIAGANELEPRVVALEERTGKLEGKLEVQAQDLAEIKGYVRAIAGHLGVQGGR
jgi:hypothetical protein